VKNGLFFEFSLCLSRACLGKIIIFYINGSKSPYFSPKTQASHVPQMP
jgi:hypothetical protein